MESKVDTSMTPIVDNKDATKIASNFTPVPEKGKAIDWNKIPFIAAKHFKEESNRKPQVIVIHCMEFPEKPTAAEQVAKYFSTTNNEVSVHYCVDNDSVVQCVQCKDTAYGAKGFNAVAIHVELAGYAAQDNIQWMDFYSVKMQEIAACLCGWVLIPKFGISTNWLSDDQIRAIAKGNKTITGITTHGDISRALKIKGGHTDPGPSFTRAFFHDKVLFFKNTPQR